MTPNPAGDALVEKAKRIAREHPNRAATTVQGVDDEELRVIDAVLTDRAAQLGRGDLLGPSHQVVRDEIAKRDAYVAAVRKRAQLPEVARQEKAVR